jgi:hypothetical protein
MSLDRGISPELTIVIILGASEWPEAPDFHNSQAFKNSASKIKEYFLDIFKLPADNLLDLFDTDFGQEEILRHIDKFISNKLAITGESSKRLKDLIIYFTGHGGFEGADSTYFLAIRHSTEKNLLASAINIHSLAHTLKKCAFSLRQFVILDACFASSATKAFQTNSLQEVVSQQAKIAFHEPGVAIDEVVPESGTTLLCSSSPHVPSKIADDQSYTMFSHGLINVLAQGSKKARRYLSIADIKKLTWDFLFLTYGDKAPRPEVHSPNQSNGDIAIHPYLPNQSYVFKEGISAKKFEPNADEIQCCILLSETEEKSRRLGSVVSGMLMSYREDIIKHSGKSNINQQPYIFQIKQAFSSIEVYRNIIIALCQSEIAIFDLTNYEPAIMFFLGVRSVVRRGVTVATAGGDYVIGDTIDFPFNIRDVNIISHSSKQSQFGKPVDIIGERVVEGFRQLRTIPGYLDLPTYDVIRKIPSDSFGQKSRDWSEQVLLLCSFSKQYQSNNWLENFKSFLPIYIKESLRVNHSVIIPPTKPEIIRTLDMKTPRLVSSSLYEAIRLTNMCVIDWTEWRPNVFFELGVRVSSNDLDPICVIEIKHKRFIEYLSGVLADSEDMILPKGIEKEDVARLKCSAYQCLGLLEWFNPIEYTVFDDETGLDETAYKNIVSVYEKQLQMRNESSQSLAFIEKDSTYNIISQVIDWEVDSAATPVHVDLINAANLLSSPEIDSQGISPVLYPQNKVLVQKSDEGALERRIAAWLYLKNRYSFEQIIANKELYNIYMDLSNLIIRGLLDSEKESDKDIIKSVQDVKSQFRKFKRKINDR